VKNFWTIWKHALGSFSDEQTAGSDDIICAVRSIIVAINISCAFLIMANVIHNWG
tara:strand:- start:778 stop:942 length:165 start_codon:yes stop_codon:yes gene_type:complete